MSHRPPPLVVLSVTTATLAAACSGDDDPGEASEASEAITERLHVELLQAALVIEVVPA